MTATETTFSLHLSKDDAAEWFIGLSVLAFEHPDFRPILREFKAQIGAQGVDWKLFKELWQKDHGAAADAGEDGGE